MAWQRIREHVDQIGAAHPPIPLDRVDLTVRDPVAVRERYGAVLRYLARVELEVDRNVLELLTLLPHATETDRVFVHEVWAPQEIQHGRILDALQDRLDVQPDPADLTTVSRKIRLLGVLAHVPGVQDVIRMLYYLTGAATERSAVIAYTRLHEGLTELGETAIAETVVKPIRRQEPTHFAFYTMSAEAMVDERVLAPWQLWLVRHLRRLSFAPVGANTAEQRRDFGGVVLDLGLADDIDDFATQVGAVERRLLWAHRRGLAVPDYVLRAFRDAVESARVAGALRPAGSSA